MTLWRPCCLAHQTTSSAKNVFRSCTMSKRKVRFNEDEDENNQETSEDKDVGDVSRRFKTKHTLDSDEEDDEPQTKSEAYNILTEDDVEGQEEDTIDHDGEIKITPFNLREEMEDGYFDNEGNYFLHKDKEIRDDWLDSVDWGKVKKLQKNTDEEMTDQGTGQFDDASEINKTEYMKQIVAILQPRETVLSALRRLGGKSKSSSASERLKAKKRKVDGDQPQAMEENKEKLLKLTELADGLLQSGEFGIYQQSYEKLQFRLKNVTGNAKADDGDDDDALEDAYMGGQSSNDKKQSTTTTSEDKGGVDDDQVYWQYKWDNEKNSQLFGPFSSSDMLEWTNEGYFKDGVLVRKLKDKNTEGDGQFYNSKRMDFELYT